MSAGTPCGNMVVGVFRNLFKRNEMWFHGMSTVKIYFMYLTQITLQKTKFTFFILSISFLCYHFIISPILLPFWHWRGVVNRIWPTFISDRLYKIFYSTKYFFRHKLSNIKRLIFHPSTRLSPFFEFTKVPLKCVLFLRSYVLVTILTISNKLSDT